MNSYQAHHARPPTIARTTTANEREIRGGAGAATAPGRDALAGAESGSTGSDARRATRPNRTNSQTPMPNPMTPPSGPMLKKAPIARPPSRSGPANEMTRNARPDHPASMPTTPDRKPSPIRMTCHSTPRAFSSEVDTGSREENASKQKDRAPFRFHRNGKGSRQQPRL